jgi:hypothetical protein
VSHLAIFEHDAQFALARAAIVTDGGNVFDSLARQRLNQIVGKARTSEAAKHDARAIGNISDSLVERRENFSYHPLPSEAGMVLPIDCSQPTKNVQLLGSGKGATGLMLRVSRQ